MSVLHWVSIIFHMGALIPLGTNLLHCDFFCQELCENERNWTRGYTSLASPWLCQYTRTSNLKVPRQ